MKTPEQKNKYRGAGFAVRTALLAVLTVGCFAMCCSFTHAWFITERGAEQNTVETATYGVTVTDSAGTVLTDGKYVCPRVPEDLHEFTLQAAGTAYTGHCVVAVSVPGQNEVGYVMELAPGQSGVVSLQAAEGSLLTFSFDWGEGENPVEPTSVFGSEDILLFPIENSRTPHLLYEVVYGASPAGIAAYYGVDVDALCTYNGLDAASANLPIYPVEDVTYAIPYVTEHPAGGPYVPRGDLVVTMNSAGDAVTPQNAFVLVTGPNGYMKQLWYSDFVSGPCTLEDLPVGEYQFTVGNVELENYTLETAVFENNAPETAEVMAASVSENAVTKYGIVNSYTRHVGNLAFRLTVTGATVTIPEDAKVFFYGPDNTVYEAYYYQLNNGSFYLTDLPTGQYIVALSGVEVKNYDLVKAETMLTVTVDQTTGQYTTVQNSAEVKYDPVTVETTMAVTQNQTTTVELAMEYKRQTGTMKLNMVASGHEVPAGAYVAIYSLDGNYIEIPYANFVNDVFIMEGAFAGDYVAKLMGADVEGYDLSTSEIRFAVKKGETVGTDVVVEYKRHQGNAAILVIAEGNTVPGTARVVLTGSDGTSYETLYASFVEGRFTVPNIPVGTYSVELVDAKIKEYDLTAYAANVVVEKGKTAEVQIAAAYKRQVGNLTVTVEVSGADLPAGALLTIVGPDGYSASMACESCTLRELPTGGYTVSATGVEVDGYTVAVTGGTAVVTKMGGGINVSIVYTAIKPASDENASGEQPEQTT